MTLYLLKVHLQTFLSIPTTQKCRILSCDTLVANERYMHIHTHTHTTHLPQQCHNSKFVIFQEKLLKVLKCYNFLWVQRWHKCSPPVASFANCVTTLYLLEVHLQTFRSIPVTQKCQISSCDTLVINKQYKGTMAIHAGWTAPPNKHTSWTSWQLLDLQMKSPSTIHCYTYKHK
jgi:hypothetical protein